ncbi:MAG: hypothetical protein JWQ35_2654, partial [Bacteriovoracaceae bacterium]|nr:hypothetical protein [Bacteriovoracaceae bacterium]
IKQTPVSAPASEPRTTLGAVLEKSPEAKAVENVVAAAVVMNTAQVTELPPIVVEPEVEILAEIAEAIPEPVPKVEVAAPKVSEAPKPEVIVTASSEAPKVETTSTDASQAEPQKEKPKLKKKTLGPTVDIDDLCSSIDAVLDHPVENDGEIRAVLFANSPEETIEKVKKEKNGTGTEG